MNMRRAHNAMKTKKNVLDNFSNINTEQSMHELKDDIGRVNKLIQKVILPNTNNLKIPTRQEYTVTLKPGIMFFCHYQIKNEDSPLRIFYEKTFKTTPSEGRVVTCLSRTEMYPDQDNADVVFTKDKYMFKGRTRFVYKMMHMSIETNIECELKIYICFGREENALKGPPKEFIQAKLTKNQNAGPSISLFELGDFKVQYLM